MSYKVNQTGSSSYILKYNFTDVQMLGESQFDALMAQMDQILFEVQKILSELKALLSSSTPPSPMQLAEALGELNALMDQANLLREQNDVLSMKVEAAGFIDAINMAKTLPSTNPAVNSWILSQLSEMQVERAKILSFSQTSGEICKEGVKAIEELAQMTASRGSVSQADVQTFLQTLTQLSDSISQARDALRNL